MVRLTSLLLAVAGVVVCATAFGSESSRDEGADAERFNLEYARYKEHVNSEAFSEALPHAQNALESGEKLFGEDSVEAATLAYNYGVLLQRLGDSEQAARSLEKALSRYQNLYGKKSVELAPVLTELAQAMAANGEEKRAERYLGRALNLQKESLGANSPEYGHALVKAGSLLMNKEIPRKARKYLRQGFMILRDSRGENDPLTGFAAFQLGRLSMAFNDHEQALEHFSLALQSFSLPDAPSNQLELTTHAFLVEVLEELGDSDRATEHCLAIGRMSPFEEDQEYLPLYKKAPDYPMNALRDGKEGTVIVEFTVDESGFVRDPRVISESRTKVFSRAALEAVRQFRYAPRFEDGKPVTTEGVQNKISFRIGG